MPNYKGHLFGGVAAFSIAFFFLAPECKTVVMGMQWLAFTLAGSLFPDVDIRSKGRKVFYYVIIAMALFLSWERNIKALSLLGFISVVPFLVKHRGILHNIWFLALCMLGLVAYVHSVAPYYSSIVVFDAFFFFVGIISHLWLDLGFRKMLRI